MVPPSSNLQSASRKSSIVSLFMYLSVGLCITSEMLTLGGGGQRDITAVECLSCTQPA